MRAFLVAMMIAGGGRSRCGAEPDFWAQATLVHGAVSVATRQERPRSRSRAAPCSARARRSRLRSGRPRHLPAQRRRPAGGPVRCPARARPAARRAGPSLGEVAHNLTRTLAARGDEEPLLKHLGGLREEGRNLVVAPRRTRVRSGPVRLVWEPAPGCPVLCRARARPVRFGARGAGGGDRPRDRVRESSSRAPATSGRSATRALQTRSRRWAAVASRSSTGKPPAGSRQRSRRSRRRRPRDRRRRLLGDLPALPGVPGRRALSRSRGTAPCLLAEEPDDRSLAEQQAALWSAIGLDPGRAAIAFEGAGGS